MDNKKEVKMCSWKWTDVILGIVILIFAFWQTMYSQWIVIIAAVVLILHALIPHPHRDMHSNMSMKKRK